MDNNKLMAKLFWYISPVLLTLPWLIFRGSGFEGSPLLISLLSGLCILGAAFLLSWACEVAQKDISQALALALLALIAILPEYAVDLYLAWKAGKDPTYASFPAANMTGANRLLVGIGWPLLVLLYFIKQKKDFIQLENTRSLEVSFLLIATLYSFIIPLKGSLSIIDFLALFSIYIIYIFSAAKAHVVEPELVGPAEFIANFVPWKRRIITIFIFFYAAFCILVSTESFIEGLIHFGKQLGIEEFLLVQWVAPLASEAPEIIIASIFVLRANPTAGLGVLLSSKINQWTLLVSMIPLAFAVSAGKLTHLVLSGRQVEEIFLTSAQSLFAIGVLANLRISILEATILLFLFVSQLIFFSPTIRYIYSGLYLLLTAIILFNKKSFQIKDLFFLLSFTTRELVSTMKKQAKAKPG
jgi:cation:H+ antiporter